MKVIVEREQLREAISAVVGRTKGSNIPILNHILVETEAQTLRLTGHDLDSCSQVSIAAEVGSPGSAAFPADRLMRLVAELPTGSQLSIQTEERTGSIKSGRSSYKFALMAADEFPPPLSPTEPVVFNLTGKQVARLFKRPAPCISDETTRPYLTGIYFHQVDGRLAACATDGHTLFLSYVDASPPKFKGVIVPAAGCSEFARVADKCDTVRLEVTDRLIAIENDSRRFVSKLIDGTFPDYLPVVPQATAPVMAVEAKEMDGALARLLTACDERRRDVKLHWTNGCDSIGAAVHSQFGDGEEQIECDCEGRPPGQVGLQIGYLRKLIDALGGARLRLFIAGPGDPVRIENPDDAGLVAVVMPCQVA